MSSKEELTLIPKYERYMQYMIEVIIKMPRTEKFNIGNEFKNIMYKMLENILYINKIENSKRLYYLNLIDTPGHVDFSYEVSRSLAACEGAILVVDAAQGIEAQTLANLYLAMNADLTIIPVINKIDLPNANIPKVKEELKRVLGFKDEEILLCSGKTGQGVKELIE